MHAKLDKWDYSQYRTEDICYINNYINDMNDKGCSQDGKIQWHGKIIGGNNKPLTTKEQYLEAIEKYVRPRHKDPNPLFIEMYDKIKKMLITDNVFEYLDTEDPHFNQLVLFWEFREEDRKTN